MSLIKSQSNDVLLGRKSMSQFLKKLILSDTLVSVYYLLLLLIWHPNKFYSNIETF